MRPNTRLIRSTIGAALLLTLTACLGPDNGSLAPAASSAPRPGGEATILLGSDFAGAWPAGLDPATNFTAGANLSLMNAIYGGLFQLASEPDSGRTHITGILAEGYELIDSGRTLVIHLRKGVRFSDGTPFDAEAVRFNIERSLDAPCACAPVSWPWASEDRVTTRDEHSVVLHFTRPFGPVMNAFPATNLNWIASPTALRQMGDDPFKIKPVGAGPFRVVSNQLSSRLVLERNPLYWQQERPYLDRLIFQSIGGEQAALQALMSGGAHAYEGMSSPPLIQQAEGSPSITVTRQPPTSPLVVQLNTRIAPFNDLRAREAIYYATNGEAIRKGLFNNWYPLSQSFTTEAGLFHHEKVPGYRTYDLDKARSTVKELGGLRVTLGTLRSLVAEQVITALQTQWREAGIEVTIEPVDLGSLIQSFQSGKWQAMLQTAGSYDPDAGSGLSFRFGKGGVFSGVDDEELARLISAATQTVDPQIRNELYVKVARRISDNAYAPFLLAPGSAQVTRNIYGPGLTTKIPGLVIGTAVLWQDVWLAH